MPSYLNSTYLFESSRQSEVIDVRETDDELVAAGQRRELERLTIFSRLRRRRRVVVGCVAIWKCRFL
jgi:hypothetical protein